MMAPLRGAPWVPRKRTRVKHIIQDVYKIHQEMHEGRN